MKKCYIGLSEIRGGFVFLDHVENVFYEEVVQLHLANGSIRHGKVVAIHGSKVAIEVFEGTKSLNMRDVKVEFSGHVMQLGVSKELLGRRFNGSGQPIDGMGPIYAKEYVDINGSCMNPISRIYPRDYIQTGISSIDALTTLIRGQKLPIFSGSGMSHNELALQITRQARLKNQEEPFCIVFAAMGIKHDVAQYFYRSFEEANVLQRTVMFVNTADDPIVERILTPRCALSAAEYLAFHENMHVLVIMSDMTSYCEALREISTSKGEIPGRKGYPAYLYSDLASLYERAGMVKDAKGSLTQIPILTMPNDDITHPIPDLSGYITEGQIVLDRELFQKGIYPCISVLPSLSRLMKDGIGKGYTREDHQPLTTQLFASYAKVSEVRALAGVIGEEELSESDQKYMRFGELFEQYFLNQGEENRSIEETLDLGWLLLSLLDRKELDRLDDDILDMYYQHEKALSYFDLSSKPSLGVQYG